MKAVDPWIMLEDFVADCSPNADPKKVVESFRLYYRELNQWNKVFNLTSLSTPFDVVIKHFMDSLFLYPLVKDEGSIVDVGSGAGFPGLPLKLLDNNLDITLLEPRRKRWSFLNHVARTLNLKEVPILCMRSSELARSSSTDQRYFDIILSRALAAPTAFLHLAEPLCADQGLVICMTSKADADSFQQDEDHCGFILQKIQPYVLPLINLPRTILVFKKR